MKQSCRSRRWQWHRSRPYLAIDKTTQDSSLWNICLRFCNRPSIDFKGFITKRYQQNRNNRRSRKRIKIMILSTLILHRGKSSLRKMMLMMIMSMILRKNPSHQISEFRYWGKNTLFYVNEKKYKSWLWCFVILFGSIFCKILIVFFTLKWYMKEDEKGKIINY